MSSKSRIKFARRREGITNYKKRLGMLKSGVPRLVVRQTNKKIIAQLIEFGGAGDRVLASAMSTELAGFGWKHSPKSVPAAYLTGMLAGRRTKDSNAGECILDSGLKTITRGSRIFAVLKGALDAGLKIPHSPESLPSGERIRGKHIADYRKVDISKDFDEVKGRIISGAAKAESPKKKATGKK